MDARLELFSDEELRRELRDREDTLIERARQERVRRTILLSGYLQVPEARALLVLLLPEHSRTTCTGDDEIANDGRCCRCTVLQAIAAGDAGTLIDQMRIVL